MREYCGLLAAASFTASEAPESRFILKMKCNAMIEVRVSMRSRRLSKLQRKGEKDTAQSTRQQKRGKRERKQFCRWQLATSSSLEPFSFSFFAFRRRWLSRSFSVARSQIEIDSELNVGEESG